MDRDAWWPIVHRIAKSQIRLSNTHIHTHTIHTGKFGLLYSVFHGDLWLMESL